MSQLKPWLLVAVIFLVGVVAGSALTVGLGSHFMHPPPPGGPEMKRRWTHDLTRQLDLTAEQQAKLGPIIDATGVQLQALHKDEGERLTKIFDDTRKQINAILTPDQQKEFAQMEKNLDRNRDRFFPDGRRPGPPPGGADGRDRPPRDFHGGPPHGDHGPDDDRQEPPPGPS